MEKIMIDDNTVLISIGENLTIETAHFFDTLVAKALEGRPSTILIGLTTMGYIDSSGIGAIIKTVNNCRKSGVRLVLYGANDDIRHLFKISKLDTFMDVKTVEDIRSEFPGIPQDR